MGARMTIEAAMMAGFTVDTHCYPPFAYKGPRFSPTERADCFTPLEAKLLKELKRSADALAYAAFNIDGSKVEGLPAGLIESTCPIKTALIAERDARAAIAEAEAHHGA